MNPQFKSLDEKIDNSIDTTNELIVLYTNLALKSLEKEFPQFYFSIESSMDDPHLFYVNVSGLNEKDDKDEIYALIDKYIQQEISGTLSYFVNVQD